MTDIAIDSCCLLNLIAAGNIIGEQHGDEFARIPYSLFIPENVEAESLYVYQPEDGTEDELVKCQVDIQNLVDLGRLERCSLREGDESDLFIQLAVRLDDGEAACLAIAKTRSWVIATDDRLARNICRELAVPALGTVQLVKSWSETVGATDEQISRSLSNIQRFARFIPRSSSPDADWWFEHIK